MGNPLASLPKRPGLGKFPTTLVISKNLGTRQRPAKGSSTRFVIYPDLGFVLSVLVKGGDTPAASALLRDLPHPLPLSLVHRLQIENGLLRSLHSSDRRKRLIAQDG